MSWEQYLSKVGSFLLSNSKSKKSVVRRDRSYRRTILPKTDKQTEYLQALEQYPVVFGIGSAGSGKTYLAAYMAAKAFDENQIDRIVLVRPAVATESLGFLPGTFEEKLDPYLKPLFDALYDRWSPEQVVNFMQSGQIEIAPLAYMRGRTLNNCYIILDEAQNTTMDQMRMFITRLGENVSCVVTGDLSQSDIKGENGLKWITEKLEPCEEYVKIIKFENQHVVRSDLVKELIKYI